MQQIIFSTLVLGTSLGKGVYFFFLMRMSCQYCSLYTWGRPDNSSSDSMLSLVWCVIWASNFVMIFPSWVMMGWDAVHTNCSPGSA